MSWTNPHLREVKRSLSQLEKLTVPTTQGRALILPGEPPQRPGELGEVEELCTAGFNPLHIVGVEEDPDRATNLYEFYFDRLQLHEMEVGEFLRLSQSLYSYIHLDFCGHLKTKEISTIQSWRSKVAPIARVRVSTCIGRAMAWQLRDEALLRRNLVENILTGCEIVDPINSVRWNLFRQHFMAEEQSEDVTHIIVTMMLMNFFFGTECWAFTDLWNNEGPYLPEVRGSHTLHNIQRFTYNESGQGGYIMATVWADLFPLHIGNDDVSWRVNEVARVFSMMSSPIPTFIPELYKEMTY